jgi:hypothetical protein
MMKRKAQSYNGRIKKTGLYGLVLIAGIAIFHISISPIKTSSLSYFQSTDLSNAGTGTFNTLNYTDPKTAVFLNHRIVTVDVVSVGSETRPDYQDAQQNTFGSHSSIRHFFRITEEDDVDQACHKNLTDEDAYEISKFCRNRKWGKPRFVMRYMRRTYAGIGWLQKKAHPAGWMCAQRRSMHGFTKAMKFYREHKESFPDYLIIMDDDTYYNMDQVTEHLTKTVRKGTPVAFAGCMFRIPIREINFTFPFGGWGLIYSGATLRNLIRPIRCTNEGLDHDTFLNGSCHVLQVNHIDEREVFREGMSLGELIDAYVAWQPYSDFRNWSKGFCLHGDWIWGFITNFYPISIHDPDPLFTLVPHARLQAYSGAETIPSDPRNVSAGGQCVRPCSIESHVCHYQTPSMMERLHASIHGMER